MQHQLSFPVQECPGKRKAWRRVVHLRRWQTALGRTVARQQRETDDYIDYATSLLPGQHNMAMYVL